MHRQPENGVVNYQVYHMWLQDFYPAITVQHVGAQLL